MTNIYIFTIDREDQYAASAHATRADADTALLDFAYQNDWLPSAVHPEDVDIQALIEELQDHGVEVNITEAATPRKFEARFPFDLSDGDVLVVLPWGAEDIPGSQRDDSVHAVALIDLARHIVAEYEPKGRHYVDAYGDVPATDLYEEDCEPGDNPDSCGKCGNPIPDDQEV